MGITSDHDLILFWCLWHNVPSIQGINDFELNQNNEVFEFPTNRVAVKFRSSLVYPWWKCIIYLHLGSISQSQVQFLTDLSSFREFKGWILPSLSWFDVDFLSHLSVLVMYFGRLNPLIIDVVYCIRYTKPNFGSWILHSSASYCKINIILTKKFSIDNLNINATGPSSIIEKTFREIYM